MARVLGSVSGYPQPAPRPHRPHHFAFFMAGTGWLENCNLCATSDDPWAALGEASVNIWWQYNPKWAIEHQLGPLSGTGCNGQCLKNHGESRDRKKTKTLFGGFKFCVFPLPIWFFRVFVANFFFYPRPTYPMSPKRGVLHHGGQSLIGIHVAAIQWSTPGSHSRHGLPCLGGARTTPWEVFGTNFAHVPPPPFAIPPPGGEPVTWPKTHGKYHAPNAQKKNLTRRQRCRSWFTLWYYGTDLWCKTPPPPREGTIISWLPPPPPGRELSFHDCPPPGGRTGRTKGGRLQGGGYAVHRAPHEAVFVQHARICVDSGNTEGPVGGMWFGPIRCRGVAEGNKLFPPHDCWPPPSYLRGHSIGLPLGPRRWARGRVQARIFWGALTFARPLGPRLRYSWIQIVLRGTRHPTVHGSLPSSICMSRWGGQCRRVEKNFSPAFSRRWVWRLDLDKGACGEGVGPPDCEKWAFRRPVFSHFLLLFPHFAPILPHFSPTLGVSPHIPSWYVDDSLFPPFLPIYPPHPPASHPHFPSVCPHFPHLPPPHFPPVCPHFPPSPPIPPSLPPFPPIIPPPFAPIPLQPPPPPFAPSLPPFSPIPPHSPQFAPISPNYPPHFPPVCPHFPHFPHFPPFPPLPPLVPHFPRPRNPGLVSCWVRWLSVRMPVPSRESWAGVVMPCTLWVARLTGLVQSGVCESSGCCPACTDRTGARFFLTPDAVLVWHLFCLNSFSELLGLSKNPSSPVPGNTVLTAVPLAIRENGSKIAHLSHSTARPPTGHGVHHSKWRGTQVEAPASTSWRVHPGQYAYMHFL